ncbi:MAG: hypothetical protein RI960_690 [Pseudomonadota bacterium]|jgi:hypothetical protein|nr:DUF465 domain-containing protein [Polynucleobacter sp.]MCF8189236.1 DUF465 domain-containing protein [Sulfuritalea sp.]
MDADEVKVRVVELEIEHRDLDTAIELLNESLTVDALQLQRLKKRKLQLKDQIIQLKMQLIPDIPA